MRGACCSQTGRAASLAVVFALRALSLSHSLAVSSSSKQTQDAFDSDELIRAVSSRRAAMSIDLSGSFKPTHRPETRRRPIKTSRVRTKHTRSRHKPNANSEVSEDEKKARRRRGRSSLVTETTTRMAQSGRFVGWTKAALQVLAIVLVASGQSTRSEAYQQASDSSQEANPRGRASSQALGKVSAQSKHCRSARCFYLPSAGALRDDLESRKEANGPRRLIADTNRSIVDLSPPIEFEPTAV